MSGDGQSRENIQRSRRQTDRSSLEPSSLGSVKVIFGEIAVCQGVEVLSPDIFALECLLHKTF